MNRKLSVACCHPPQFLKSRCGTYECSKAQIASLITKVMSVDSLAYHASVLLSCEKRSLLTDYKWVRLLGKGGFGRVHQCENRYAGEQRAIKLLLPEGGEFGDLFKQDVQETELQQKLASSEYIAKIYGWGTFAGKLRANVFASWL